MGDKRRFQQVLINLIKNAIKFTHRGQIQIKAWFNVPLSSLIVHIVDDGVGIASEDFPTLFTRFGKLNRTAEQNSTGIGLGLMIVKQIVEKNGGKIEVHSDGIGKGTCMMFSMKMELVPESYN